MKLGQLNAALRALDGAPKVAISAPGLPGQRITLQLQKTPLIEELGRVYGGRGVETGIYLRPDGFLGREADRPAGEVDVAEADAAPATGLLL